VHQNKTIIFQNLGLIDYQKAWDYQEELFKGIVDIKIQNRQESFYAVPFIYE
jgi:lipoyl(octanoyl) transferase